jgi:hypothetical protein
LALVFFQCGLAAIDLPEVLSELGRVSGYPELAAAPLMFVGHSAGGPQAKALAIRLADRCFGVVQYRGGVPGGEQTVPPGVPALMMIGQFDEFGGTMRDASGRETWEGGRDALRAFRAINERHLGSVVVEPGAGHFAWSDRNAHYLALFLRKAADARIPPVPARATAKPVALQEIDPASGWLTDLSIASPGKYPPAAYHDYEGDKSAAAWHFDREMAEATVAYHAGGFGKQDQFIRWEDPYWVDAGTRFFFTKIAWCGDGQTFEVHPVYAAQVPGVQRDGRGPRWVDAGQPVGHADVPIRVGRVGGPVVVAGPHRLRIRYDALAGAEDRTRVTFLACSPGDDRYRYTEQVGMLPRGFSGLKQGAAQAITFPEVADLKPGSRGVTLGATSDSGLPVEYYVAYGPATVTGDQLATAELPVRARFPIEVKIVAYQFGRGIEPLVQTADPVARTLRILRP